MGGMNYFVFNPTVPMVGNYDSIKYEYSSINVTKSFYRLPANMAVL